VINKALAACGIVAAVLLPLSWIVLGVLEPHFSLLDNDGSDLGAIGSHYAATWNLIISASGVLVVLCSIALVRTLPGGAASRVGSLLVTVVGAGFFIDGLNREDCSTATSKACLKAVETWHISRQFQVHIIESIVTFIALISASLVLRVTFRASRQWRDLAAFSLLAASVQIACQVAITVFSGVGLGDQGIVEFIANVAGLAWLAVVAVRVISMSRECRTRRDWSGKRAYRRLAAIDPRPCPRIRLGELPEARGSCARWATPVDRSCGPQRTEKRSAAQTRRRTSAAVPATHVPSTDITTHFRSIKPAAAARVR
jgi:hypothetical membrane protein